MTSDGKGGERVSNSAGEYPYSGDGRNDAEAQTRKQRPGGLGRPL